MIQLNEYISENDELNEHLALEADIRFGETNDEAFPIDIDIINPEVTVYFDKSQDFIPVKGKFTCGTSSCSAVFEWEIIREPKKINNQWKGIYWIYA